MTGIARREPQIWMALLLICVGVGLLGYVAGAWLESGAAPGMAAMVQSTHKGSATRSSAMPANSSVPTVMLPVAILLAFWALTLLLRARDSNAGDATRDPVTGLYSHVYMQEMVPGLMARDDRSGVSQLTLMMLEVDFLDHVRERHGKAGVDRILAVLGRTIRSQTRAGDVPVRIDGQGLAVFLQCGEVDQAIAFGRRLGTLLAGEQLELGGDVIKISVGMGVAVRRPGDSLEMLLVRTAEKLALARESGSNRIVA